MTVYEHPNFMFKYAVNAIKAYSPFWNFLIHMLVGQKML